MNLPENLKDYYDIFAASYDNFFTAIHSKKENEKFSILEFDGVIHRFEVALLFSLQLIKVYLTTKNYAYVETEEEAIALAYENKIISNKAHWLLTLEISQLCYLSHSQEGLNRITLCINGVFQDILIELYEYFKDKF